MSDTIVIDGEVELLNVIDGDPDVFIGGGGSQPTGTKSILLTEAGTLTEDVASYASAEINAVKSATASGAIASFSDGAEDVPMDSCVVDIEPVQSGTGDPSPSNVRPISGWSEVNVYATGVNVWDEQWETGSITTTTGQKASGSNVISKNYIPVRPNTTFSTTVRIRIFFYKSDKTYISYIDKNAGATFTTPSECYYLLLTAFQAYGTTYNHDISINYPSTDTTYHAYTGTSYPISLGQTVYGGTLDVVTGVLTVDRAYVGGSNWEQYKASNGYKAYRINNVPYSKDNASLSNMPLCNMLNKYGSFSSSSMTENVIQLPTPAVPNMYMALDENLTASDVYVSYLMKDPVTYQLTPTEVTTLLGSNSVWADSGDIAVGYKADVYLTPTGTKQISITQNGTTTEDVTNYASASITTNVPASAVDTGTKSISSNGTHDVVGYANANVNVPNSYSQSDEGKVVSNGALVAQTSDTVTANDTYDTTLINSLTVNVSGGGGYTLAEIASKSEPSGTVDVTGVVMASYGLNRFPAITRVQGTLATGSTLDNAFADNTGLVTACIIAPSAVNGQHRPFGACTNLVTAVLITNETYGGMNYFNGCSKLEKADLFVKQLRGNSFYNCSKLATLVLRNTNAVCILESDSIMNQTPFKSGGAGGTIYIPKVLYDHLGDGTALDYQSATNWATIYGYGTITWAKIEGSIYENAYADGTPISS